jgi:hypothetical protein
VSRDRRNTQTFWLLLVVLIVVFSYGAYAAGTVDHCGTGKPEKWVWMPPHWQCL